MLQRVNLRCNMVLIKHICGKWHTPFYHLFCFYGRCDETFLCWITFFWGLYNVCTSIRFLCRKSDCIKINKPFKRLFHQFLCLFWLFQVSVRFWRLSCELSMSDWSWDNAFGFQLSIIVRLRGRSVCAKIEHEWQILSWCSSLNQCMKIGFPGHQIRPCNPPCAACPIQIFVLKTLKIKSTSTRWSTSTSGHLSNLVKEKAQTCKYKLDGYGRPI